MKRYHLFTQSAFGFPEKGKMASLLKIGYISFYDAITYSLGRICPIKDLFELNSGTIRRKNGHFILLTVCQRPPNLRSRILDFNLNTLNMG